MVTQFQNNDLNLLEKNMMRGMFRRKLKDFAEQQKENCDHTPLIDRLKQADPAQLINESTSEMGSLESYKREQISPLFIALMIDKKNNYKKNVSDADIVDVNSLQ